MQKLEKLNFSKMRSVFFFALVSSLLVAMVYLFRPFFYPLFWAAVIAVMFYPHYQWLSSYLKMPTLNSAIMVGVVILTIFVPSILVMSLLVNQVSTVYNKIDATTLIPQVKAANDWIKSATPFGAMIPNSAVEWTTKAAEFGNEVSSFVLDNITEVTQNSVKFIFNLFLMFYALFFFFRDGERILNRLKHLSPLGEKYEIMLYDRFTSTARATLKSTLIVGFVQGALGGLVFWLTGVPGAFVWAVVMTVFCVIPAVGSFVVWLPIGLITLLMGNVWQGLTILLVGLLLISTIDNVLRPLLVGGDIQMHPMLVLFSTLGGIFLFGVSGFVIGPVLASLCIATMSIYDHYYKHELDAE